MDFTKNMAGDGRAFTTKMKTEIGDSGIQDIWEDYINSNWGIMEAEQEAGITRRMGKSRKTMHLPVNEWGEPIVPDVDLVAESGEVPAEFSGLRDYFQTMLRTFLSMHWGLAGPVTAKDPTVPWSDIIKDPRQYICSEYLPDDMVGLFKDPSKVPIGDCLTLLSFWLARQRAGEDVVFEFSHWQKSRYKAPVPREPRREAPEIPAKPGYQHVESSESSEDETEERQTRSSTAKGGKRKADSGGKRSLVKLQESDGDSEEDDSADDEEWRGADDDEWGGVSEDEDTVSSGAKGGVIGRNLGSEARQDLSESSEEQGPIKPPEFDKRGSSEDDSESQAESSVDENETLPPALTNPGSSPGLWGDERDPVSKITLSVPPSPVAGLFEDDLDLAFLGDLGVQDVEVSAGKKRNRADSEPGSNMGSTHAESDNGLDVDKTSQMGDFKIGPPRKKKKKKSAQPNAGPISHPPSETQPNAGPISHPPSETQPQDSPAKNTQSQDGVPRPRRVANIPGTSANLDDRFDYSNRRETRSLYTPKPPPGHYARLNGGR